MNKLLALSLTDCRNIFREQILYIMFVGAPVAQFLIARFLLPWVGEQFPAVVPYFPLIVMLMIVQVVSSIGFVGASILLDERDEDVLTAIRVMPVSATYFLTYRLLFTVLVSLAYALAMIRFTGLVFVPWPEAVAAAFLFACLGPVVLLVLAVFSTNKVEGLAVFKGLSLVLLLPAASFFISGGLKYAFGDHSGLLELPILRRCCGRQAGMGIFRSGFFYSSPLHARIGLAF
jgi:fluoroquinolone transport system permease protein